MCPAYLFFLLLVFAICFFYSCSSTIKRKDGSPLQTKFSQAKKTYNKKNYLAAIEDFQSIVFDFPGSEVIDSAIFFLAESYYNTKDYILAENEYRNLLRDFPYSKLADHAQFKLGETCYNQSLPAELDQTKTKESIEEFNIFLENHPHSPFVPEVNKRIRTCRNKLALKELKNGNLYYKIKDYHAALLYYEDVISYYPDAECVSEAQYKKASSLISIKRYKEAKTILQDLKKTKNTKLNKKINLLLSRIPNN